MFPSAMVCDGIRPLRCIVLACPVRVCPEGHVSFLDPVPAVIIFHSCGSWTWEAADFCANCGEAL